MQRSVLAAQQLFLRAGAAGSLPSATECVRQASTVAVTSLEGAPTSTGSKIKIDLKPAAGGALGVSVSAGGATASGTITAAALSAAQATPTTLHEVARVNVLHSSLQHYLLHLLQDRFAVLAEFPDFSTYFGKDVYYRSNPETIREFYSLVDEYHRMYDTATEFESLSHLANDLIPAYRKRLLNPIHPAITPTTANSAVTSFLLGHLKA